MVCNFSHFHAGLNISEIFRVFKLAGPPPPPSNKSPEAEDDAHVSFDLNGAGYGPGQGLRARDRRKALLTATLLPYLLSKLDVGHERYDEDFPPDRMRCTYVRTTAYILAPSRKFRRKRSRKSQAENSRILRTDGI